MKCNLFFICMALSATVHAQFSGAYAPANWTTTHRNAHANSSDPVYGSVNTSDAPSSIVINGPDNPNIPNNTLGSYASIRYSIPINQAGTISFNYSINNMDVAGPGWDHFFWGKGNTMIDSLSGSGSGTVSIPVAAGDILVLGASTSDETSGKLIATISNFSVLGTALPILGTELSVQYSGVDHILTWTTISEHNNRGFEIQRSFDARSFSPIGFVASLAADGNAQTTLDYTFVDKDAAHPELYYRYRQIDHDGAESYSNVVMMKKTATATQTEWSVYPNPVKKGQTLSLNNEKEGTLQLFDVKGSLMYTQTLMKKAMIQLPDHLAAGTYFCTLQTAVEKQSATLVIK